MSVAEPQPILSHPTEAAIFLVLTVRAGSEAEVADVLADVPGIKRSVGFRVPEAELSYVVGVGAALWDRLDAGSRPDGLHPFRELVGPHHTAVATPGDVLFHIRAHRFDLCFELAQRLIERLRGRAEVVDEVHGFRSFDERDVLGFVDGTENPEGRAATEAVLIGEEEPRFAGGSYVIVQKYLHNLTAWDGHRQPLLRPVQRDAGELDDASNGRGRRTALLAGARSRRRVARDRQPPLPAELKRAERFA